jgi:glutathione S-transferase
MCKDIEMKLLSATPNPYARKVRVALAEKSLPFKLQTKVPWNEGTSLPQHNPLEKLPMILDDGSTIWESCTGYCKQHFLYFLPLPHGHGSLRPIFSRRGNAWISRGIRSAPGGGDQPAGRTA